ncbi:MAG: hypothetical protein ACRDO2_02650 [Nocardioidaceae bacterium]
MTLRTTLVGVTAAALLVTPAAATALAPADSAASGPTTQVAPATTAARYNTWVRFLRFDHTRPWRSRVHIKGQVAARVDGQRGALRGVRVTLFRQLDGRTRWVRLASTTTSRTDRPKFRFDVRAKANADYRVAFRGNARFQPSRAATHAAVHRIFNARLRDGTGRFRGRVQPNYGNKVIYLEKRSCANCGWHRVRSKRTSDRGYWRFKVGAPSSGRWWWRASVPGSTAYIHSISGVFTTQRS